MDQHVFNNEEIGKFIDSTKPIYLKVIHPFSFYRSLVANHPSSLIRFFQSVIHAFLISVGFIGSFFIISLFMTMEPIKLDFSKDWLKLYWGFVTLFIVCYWNMDTHFGRKWQFCADHYNRIIQTSDPKLISLQEVALAVELVDAELWANETFSTFFRKVMMEASKHYDTKNNGLYFTEKLKNNLITTEESHCLLFLYSSFLGEKLKKRTRTRKQPSIKKALPPTG